MRKIALTMLAFMMLTGPALANFYTPVDRSGNWELYAFVDRNDYNRRYCAFKTEFQGRTVQIRNYWNGAVEMLYHNPYRNYFWEDATASINFSNGNWYGAEVGVGDVESQLAYYELDWRFIEDFAANSWFDFQTPDETVWVELRGTRHLVNQLRFCVRRYL